MEVPRKCKVWHMYKFYNFTSHHMGLEINYFVLKKLIKERWKSSVDHVQLLVLGFIVTKSQGHVDHFFFLFVFFEKKL